MTMLGRRSVAWRIVAIAGALALVLGTCVSLNVLRGGALDRLERGAQRGEDFPYHIKGVSANARAILEVAAQYLPGDDSGLEQARTLAASFSDAHTMAEVRQNIAKLYALIKELDGRITGMSAAETIEIGIYFGGLDSYEAMLADDGSDVEAAWFNDLLERQPAKAVAWLFHIPPLTLSGDLPVADPDAGRAASAAEEPERGRYLALDYVNAFKTAGFPVGTTMDYDEVTDPISLLGRPGSYYSKANFNDTEAKIDHLDEKVPEDAVIEVFYTKQDLESRRRYLQSVSEAFPLFRMYTYVSPDGLALFRLDYEILPAHAEQYRAAFEEFCQTGRIAPYTRLASPTPKPQ